MTYTNSDIDRLHLSMTCKTKFYADNFDACVILYSCVLYLKRHHLINGRQRCAKSAWRGSNHSCGTTKRKSARKRNLGKYKSSIEKYCADQLREHGLAFDYEKDTFELMESFTFPNKYFKMTAKGKVMRDRSNSVVLPITYTPDFVGKDRKWIIYSFS